MTDKERVLKTQLGSKEIELKTITHKYRNLQAFTTIVLTFGILFTCIGFSVIGSKPEPIVKTVVQTQLVYVTSESTNVIIDTATPEPTIQFGVEQMTLNAGMTQVVGHMTQTAEAPIQPTATVQPKPTAGFTMAQLNAIDTAQSYLSFMAFSRSGLIDQLVFEGYSVNDAEFAVDFLSTDWTEQAYQKAKEYLDFSPFSLDGLIAQLEFEGFTTEQATTGATRAYSE